MKQFTKTLPKRHPLSVEIRELHGAEAFTYLTDLLDLAQEIGKFELTPKIVARECGLKSQKVQRIFENLSRIFEESCNFLGLSSKNPSESSKIVQESSKYPERSTPQNPHGSTRDLEKSREEKKRGEKSTPLPPTASFENLPTDHQPILTFVNSTTKERISEVDLLRRDCIQLINSSRVARINLLGDSLTEFCECNPTAKNMVYAWLKHPPAVRMAAIAYAFTCPHKANQFDWALKAIKGDWESYQKFIPACQLMVDAGDYTLEV